MQELEIQDIQRHRNGVCGEPFTVVMFRWYDDTDNLRNMVGVVFDAPDMDEDEEDAFTRGEFFNPPTAVLDRDSLAAGNARFGANSWRGDHFDHALRTAINAVDYELMFAGPKT